MSSLEKILKDMKNNPKNIGFNDLVKLCNHYFGKPRQNGSSHKVYQMPWPGDPSSLRKNPSFGSDGRIFRFENRRILNVFEDRKNEKDNPDDQKWGFSINC